MEQRHFLRMILAEGFLPLTSILTANQVCQRWSEEIERTVLWSHKRISAASLALAARTHATIELTRRGRPSKIMSMNPRPALINFVSGEMCVDLARVNDFLPRTLKSLARLLAAARLRPGETFADLGCGAGRQLLGAMALVPGLRKLVGYELMEGYLNTARAHLADQPALLLHEDFTESPDEWLDADVVLAVSTCFDRDQMNKLSMLTQRLRRKAVTVKCFGDWGSALGRVYVQTTSQRKRTARETYTVEATADTG